MMPTYEAGDVKLISLKLTNTNETAIVDIRSQCTALSIFEDIEQPTLYAEFTIVDSLNLVKDFPIIGEETLEVSFITPGREKATTYKFRIYAVDGTVNATNAKASSYTLKGVSSEHFINAILQIDKGYNTTVAEIVKDILNNEIKTKKPLIIETTRGLIPMTVPRTNPFVAIDFLRQKAIAKRPSGGVFVFYENQYGFNFTTLETLIEDGKNNIKSKTFTYEPATNADASRSSYAFRNIQRYQHLTKFDTVDKMGGGLYKNTSRSFDITTKQFEEVAFELDQQAYKFETGEKKTKIPNTEKLISEAKQGAPFYMFAPKDSSKGNDYVADLLGYRTAFTKLFNQNITRLMVFGDNYLTVGDMVELNFPDTSGTTEKKLRDERYSGNYMVTKLRHIIYLEDKKFKHNIAMDCNKIGFNA